MIQNGTLAAKGGRIVRAAESSHSTIREGCDFFFCHWHFLDDVKHFHLAPLDPTWIRYDPKDAEKHWDMVRQAYRAIDHMMAPCSKELPKTTP